MGGKALVAGPLKKTFVAASLTWSNIDSYQIPAESVYKSFYNGFVWFLLCLQPQKNSDSILILDVIISSGDVIPQVHSTDQGSTREKNVKKVTARNMYKKYDNEP